jgi:hypothetical protein
MLKLNNVSQVHTASIIRAIIIALMEEAVRTSETSVNFNVTTRHYIPEDSKLYTCHHENLKPHIIPDSLKGTDLKVDPDTTSR